MADSRHANITNLLQLILHARSLGFSSEGGLTEGYVIKGYGRVLVLSVDGLLRDLEDPDVGIPINTFSCLGTLNAINRLADEAARIK